MGNVEKWGKSHLYTKLYTLSTCKMPFFLVEKTAKTKHLFCNIFPKAKYLKKILDLFEKEKFKKINEKI